MDHTFIDLHKVDGLLGVYIATQLEEGFVGRRHLSSWITFDKGGEWRHLPAPSVDINGNKINCHPVSIWS